MKERSEPRYIVVPPPKKERSRKRFPGYFSKEEPHASWEEVIEGWWIKLSPEERAAALEIKDMNVRRKIWVLNNNLLYKTLILNSGVGAALTLTQRENKVMVKGPRRGGLFYSSASESDSDYPLLDMFNNYFERALKPESLLCYVESMENINIKRSALIEDHFFPKLMEKASHRRFLRRKWVPKPESEVWEAIEHHKIYTWGDFETALALILENNMLNAYEPIAKQLML